MYTGLSAEQAASLVELADKKLAEGDVENAKELYNQAMALQAPPSGAAGRQASSSAPRQGASIDGAANEPALQPATQPAPQALSSDITPDDAPAAHGAVSSSGTAPGCSTNPTPPEPPATRRARRTPLVMYIPRHRRQPPSDAAAKGANGPGKAVKAPRTPPAAADARCSAEPPSASEHECSSVATVEVQVGTRTRDDGNRQRSVVAERPTAVASDDDDQTSFNCASKPDTIVGIQLDDASREGSKPESCSTAFEAAAALVPAELAKRRPRVRLEAYRPPGMRNREIEAQTSGSGELNVHGSMPREDSGDSSAGCSSQSAGSSATAASAPARNGAPSGVADGRRGSAEVQLSTTVSSDASEPLQSQSLVGGDQPHSISPAPEDQHGDQASAAAPGISALRLDSASDVSEPPAEPQGDVATANSDDSSSSSSDWEHTWSTGLTQLPGVFTGAPLGRSAAKPSWAAASSSSYSSTPARKHGKADAMDSWNVERRGEGFEHVVEFYNLTLKVRGRGFRLTP